MAVQTTGAVAPQRPSAGSVRDTPGQHPSVPLEEWTAKHIEERLGILSAVRLPEDCRHMADDRLGGVNTFRVVLACLAGDDRDLLPDLHMLANYREATVHEIDIHGDEAAD